MSASVRADEIELAREELLGSLKLWERIPVRAGDGYGVVLVRVWAVAALLAATRQTDQQRGERQ